MCAVGVSGGASNVGVGEGIGVVGAKIGEAVTDTGGGVGCGPIERALHATTKPWRASKITRLQAAYRLSRIDLFIA